MNHSFLVIGNIAGIGRAGLFSPPAQPIPTASQILFQVEEFGAEGLPGDAAVSGTVLMNAVEQQVLSVGR